MSKNNIERGAVDKEFETRKKGGMHSLLMMVLGACLAVMIAVFFYMSPFFNQKTTAPLNVPLEVVPLAESDVQQPSFEFYEVLPEQEFRSIPEGVSVQSQAEEVTQELPIDEIVYRSNRGGAHDEIADTEPTEIVVVEENATYDDPAPIMHIQPVTSNVTYILQVRSYNNADDADRRRAEVLMTGVDAEVVKRRDAAGSVIYQVISTPFVSRDSAMMAYKRLQSNGIDSVVVEQKR